MFNSHSQFREDASSFPLRSSHDGKDQTSLYITYLHFMIDSHAVNVVQLLGVCTHPELCIVTEFMANGSLQGYLRANPKINESLKLEWMKGIAFGVVSSIFCEFSSNFL